LVLFFKKELLPASSGEPTNMNFGFRVYGIGIIALGVVCLASRDFVLSQVIPDNFAHRTALAYGGGAFMLAAGAAIEWPRVTPMAAAALVVFYCLVVLIPIDLPYIFSNSAVYGTYSNIAEELAVTAAGLIIFATTADIDASIGARLAPVGRITFGVCALLFGGAHFVYMNLTVPLVPKYLPPSQEFWAYATGFAHIVAGLAILAGVRDRLAAILLTVMYASFTPLVHLPMLLAAPGNKFYWSENAVNLALTGAAWVVADSLRRRRVVV
jgi:uncharacterized membrane protein